MADQETRERLAVFRFDASPAIGGGHALRCKTLADALQKDHWACRYVIGDQTLFSVPRLKEQMDDCLELSGTVDQEPERIRDWLANDHCDLLIVDHYGRDHTFETSCRNFAPRILVIDDLADRKHDCDFVLDQTFGRMEKDYSGLVPASCGFFLGAEFALLNSRYADLREQNLKRRRQASGIRRILISIGLTDPLGLSRRALEQVSRFDDMEIDIVLGVAAPGLESIKALAGSMGRRIKVHVDNDDLSNLMTEADLSIGACGSTSWERCCLGLPTLGIIVAENQQLIADNLSRAGALDVVSDVDNIGETVEGYINNPDRLRQMTVAAAVVCDGLGSARVISGLTV